MSKQTYIGIVERNQWEGETFGYYFPIEAADAVRDIFDRFHRSENTNWISLEENVSHKALLHLDRYDRNGYMGRVTVFECDDWGAYAKALDPEVDQIYKGFPANQVECRTVKDWQLQGENDE